MSEPHYHHCPLCYESELCDEGCMIEPDLGTHKGLPYSDHTECSKCERYTWPCCDAMDAARRQGDATVIHLDGPGEDRPALRLKHGGAQALAHCPWCGEEYTGRTPSVTADNRALAARGG